ncbi:MAG: penicillin-binding protein activator LpoB [Burkholderiales bacterium]|nr:penicillin-binding protein activator LpoB [Burkholderiales bacterium]
MTLHRLLVRLTAAAVFVLGGCTTVDIGAPPAVERGARWALLPIMNHTETPQAGLRAEVIVDGVLRANGVAGLRRYPAGLNNESLFEPLERKQFDAALAWARGAGARYALAGAVDEWRYKVGIDGEPAVGVTLQVIDVPTGEVVWSAAGGKTGWSREALSAVAQKLIRQLLQPVIGAAR